MFGRGVEAVEGYLTLTLYAAGKEINIVKDEKPLYTLYLISYMQLETTINKWSVTL